MKKIMLPPSFQRQAADLAVDYLIEKKNLTPPRDFKPYAITDLEPSPTDDRFTREFKATVYRLCEEAVTHSFTPGIEPGSNPRPGKVNPEYYGVFEFFFGPENVFKTRISDTLAAKKASENFKIVLGRLVDSISEDFLGAQITGRKKMSTAGLDSQLAEEKKFLTKLYVMSCILTTLRMVFEITHEDIDAFLKNTNAMPLAVNEQQKKAIIARTRDYSFRKAFVGQLKKIGSMIFKRTNLGEEIAELASVIDVSPEAKEGQASLF